MIHITKEQACLLHELMAAHSGGGVGIREEGLLESALESPFTGFAGFERYPTVEEKAARLGYTLISNHAFVDGNKRIGILILLTFLECNGIKLNLTDADVIHAALSVADGSMNYDGLLDWILSHK